VHNETSTGVTSDLAAIGAAIDAARHPALFLVDVVSALEAGEHAALPRYFFDWRPVIRETTRCRGPAEQYAGAAAEAVGRRQAPAGRTV